MNEGKIAALSMELAIAVGESGCAAGERLIAIAQLAGVAASGLVPLADDAAIARAWQELDVGLDEMRQRMLRQGVEQQDSVNTQHEVTHEQDQ